MIWQSPFYQFIIPNKQNAKKYPYKQIIIDVTDSAPPFPDPKETLASVLDEVVRYAKDKPIIDFGAGKLRNTIYLLKKRKTVCPIEFEQIHTKTKQGKEMYEEAQNYRSNLKKLTFPHQFFSSSMKSNLCLLVNVCNIMPVHSERLLVLQYCREKLTKDGYVLWYTQHKDQDMVAKCTPDVEIGDGYYTNKERRYQTFYRDFDNSEIDAMFLASGFRLYETYPAGKNQARVYKKVGNSSPLQDIVTASKIRNYVIGDKKIKEPEKVGPKLLTKSAKSKLNIPNPEELRDEALYITALETLPKGTHPTEYQNLIAAVLIKLFVPPLSNPRLEVDLNDGLERLDMMLTNSAENGFFGKFSQRYRVPSPFILIECKNYTNEIANTEIAQLNGRFKARWGKFGIIAYRMDTSKDSRKELVKRCRTHITDENPNYILCLNDKDFIEMLNRKISGDSIDEYLFEKMEELIVG